MTKIKVLGNASREGMPVTEPRPGFSVTFDPACEDYDWLVVFDELPFDDRGTYRAGREPLRCPPEHTILCTWEPTSIKGYSRAYVRQFAHYLSNRPPEAEGHPGYVLGRGYFPWCHGHTEEELAVHPVKTKVVSAVCSSKRMKHTKHAARYELVSTLAKGVDGFDWFGHGVRPIARKYEALDAYKYHVTVENHIGAHHWTEKFADAILCECLPFYAGDPAIGEIFPKECFIPIPIDDPQRAMGIVRAAIASGEYERRLGAIREAKRLILEKYNFIDQVIGVITSAAGSPTGARPTAIYSRRRLRWHSPSALLEDFLWRIRSLLPSSASACL